MNKATVFSSIALAVGLSAGGLVNIQSANAAACAPGMPCGGGGGGNFGHMQNPRAGMAHQGNMRHQGNQQMGQNHSGNMDWRHHRRHGFPGVGVGIYLGDGYADNYNGYDGNYYDGGSYRGVSCGEARGILTENGFHNLRTRSCAPGRYSFRGVKHGLQFALVVSSRGRIVSVNQI
jgi:hypothetical protein